MRKQVDEERAGTPRPASTALLPTLLRLTSSGGSVREGQPLHLTVQVRTVAPVAGPRATGEVEFRAGTRLLGVAGLDDQGGAVLRDVRLGAGLHALTATYGGDGRHEAAVSTPLPQAVTAAAAPVLLLVATPAAHPDGLQLEAELVDLRSGRLADDATGTLVFTVEGAPVASAELVGGHARAVVPVLPPGALEAQFDGDTEHAAAWGATHAAGEGA